MDKKAKSRTPLGHFLNVSEVADQLGVSVKTVTRWCESGKLPAIPKAYGNKTTYQISPAALELVAPRKPRQKAASYSEEATPEIASRPHADYLASWKAAMTKGLLTGKPYSKSVIWDYNHYVGVYLSRSRAISIEGLKAELMRYPAERYSSKLHTFKAVSCFAKYLIMEKALDEGFLQEAKRLAPKRHLPPKRLVVNADGLEKLVNACEGVLDRTLLLLLANTGLRASEFCALKLSDIDMDQRVLTVRLGKGGKSRAVGLNEMAFKVLSQYLAERGSSSKAFLFLDAKGRPMNRSGLYQRLERIGKAAGVAVTPHALRRAFVTLNANKGRPLQMLQMACGHSDIKTTMSYCRTSETEMINAMRDW